MEIFKSEIITSPIPDKPYYKGINTWEYGSFEEAVKFAVIEADKCEMELFGSVMVFCDDLYSMEKLPSRNLIYKVDGKLVTEDQVENYEGDRVETIEEVLHTVEWTKGLGIEYNRRLVFYYCDKDGSETILSRYNKDSFNPPLVS